MAPLGGLGRGAGRGPDRSERYSNTGERRLPEARMLTGRLAEDTPADHSFRILLSFD